MLIARFPLVWLSASAPLVTQQKNRRASSKNMSSARLLSGFAEVCLLSQEHRPDFLSQCCCEFLRQLLSP